MMTRRGARKTWPPTDGLKLSKKKEGSNYLWTYRCTGIPPLCFSSQRNWPELLDSRSPTLPSLIIGCNKIWQLQGPHINVNFVKRDVGYTRLSCYVKWWRVHGLTFSKPCLWPWNTFSCLSAGANGRISHTRTVEEREREGIEGGWRVSVGGRESTIECVIWAYKWNVWSKGWHARERGRERRGRADATGGQSVTLSPSHLSCMLERTSRERISTNKHTTNHTYHLPLSLPPSFPFTSDKVKFLNSLHSIADTLKCAIILCHAALGWPFVEQSNHTTQSIL